MSGEAASPRGLQGGGRCQRAAGRGREGISASLGELQLHAAKSLPGDGGFARHSPGLPGRHLRGCFLQRLLQTSGLPSARRSSEQQPGPAQRRLQISSTTRGRGRPPCCGAGQAPGEFTLQILGAPRGTLEPCPSAGPAAQHDGFCPKRLPGAPSRGWGLGVSTERSYLLLSAGAWGWQTGPTEPR